MQECMLCGEELDSTLMIDNYVLVDGKSESCGCSNQHFFPIKVNTIDNGINSNDLTAEHSVSCDKGKNESDELVDEIGSILQLRSNGRSKLAKLFIKKTVEHIIGLFLEDFTKSPTQYRYVFSVKAEDIFLLSLIHRVASAVKERLKHLDVEVLVEGRAVNNYEGGYYQNTLSVNLPLYRY